jgi:hypothetical protein
MTLAINNPFNGVREIRAGDRQMILKAHTCSSVLVHAIANIYFRLAGIPIRFLTDHGEWRRREIECFCSLNGRRQAFAYSENTVCLERLPGEDLFAHVSKGTLTRQMVNAAAREFRRAHETRTSEFDGPWSHGDGTMSNVVFDPITGQASLIDFETVHNRSLAAPKRHADDLFVFLLDLVALAPAHCWLGLSLSFVRTYGESLVIEELRNMLRPPRGLAFVWWRVRTNFVNTRQLLRRLARLRKALARV